ncbi:microtubule-associated serine/threonine-protein kinase 2-like isoform X2 [Hydractinia symbiolongicarpus]|uniref:microtubule-associated serine/threonine-protein kinase 2-like isoform X2 n=1 Tax=Hydractinia symbiolongicarpus TaxID=13093 RepID=UPI00254F2334|nr:microtubule-associated serine/threonine-protein kinase 2-like isoform X2 [Hydractinia symbiolongicarpus]
MEVPMYQFEKPRINPDQIPGRKDLLDYFKRKQIEKYLEIFPKTVNFAFFKTMSEDDFQEYGISDDNDMQILLDAVAQAQAEEDAEEEAELLFDSSQQTSASSSPTTPTHKRHIQILDSDRRKSSFFGRSSSIEPFSPIRDEHSSNLLRMRNNASLGNSDPSLSSSYGDITKKFSTCGISPRRPRSLLPHSPSPPRAKSPIPTDNSFEQSPKHLSPNNNHAPIPFSFATNKVLQSGRRWSVASSGYSTNTPCSSGFSSRTSSQEKLNQLIYDDHQYIPLSRQYSHDSTYSDVDDDVLGRARSPKPYRGRSRSLSPTRSENEISILNKLYMDRFPKAKTQMEEKLQEFCDEYADDSKFSDAAISFVFHQILEIAKTVLKVSIDPEVNITSAFFYDISDSLDKLLFEVRTKTASREIGHIHRMISKLLMILSRPARLLECLEFNPSSFYTQLEVEEHVLSQNQVDVDMGSYIRTKLGIAEVGEEEKQESEAPVRKQSILIEPKDEDFSYIKLISNGAYGSVYLVRHKASRQRYAMKKMRKHHLMHKNQVQQVFTERDIMTFAQNPFVVTLVCTFETKKYLCMVMEYVEGGDCASLLKNIGVMTVDLAKQYFAETVLAVEYIHDYGIIHRDLKPDNLLITAMGHIKLTDFGLSKMGLMNMTTNICEQTAQQFNDATVFGTPDYIAPEVILRKGYAKPVDYWSLGIILYEFLVGITPFFGETVDEVFEFILNGEIEWPDGDDALPPDPVDLIKRLLVQEPTERLGAGGAKEVKEHEFFEHVNWNSLLRQKAEFVPVLDDDEDTSYFDTREDRYNHLVSDDEEDVDVDDIEIGNFSTCSPRFSQILSSADISRELKDLEETSKEASSVEDLHDESSFESGIKNHSKEEEASDDVDNNTIIEYSSLKTKMVVKTVDDKVSTDSGNETPTSSSLDNSLNSSCSLARHIMDSKRCEDSDRDTDASTSSCDLSPRKFISTATFTSQRVPSPKQPSPLVIDTSHDDTMLLKTTSTSSAPNTPLDKSLSASYGTGRTQRTKSTPPCLDLSKINQSIPRLELSASEDETVLLRKPRRRSSRHGVTRRQGLPSQTTPESPTGKKDLRRMSSPTSLRPPILITRGSRGLGFSLKAIRVHIGESSNYTLQHLVESVDKYGPAYEAGLKENDLITHVNGESTQGLQHVDLVRLIMQGGEVVKLTVTELSNTSIRTGTKRKQVGSRILSRKPRSRSRTNSSAEERSNSRKSAIYKRIKKPLRRNSSVKRSSKKSALAATYQSANNGGAANSSPNSPSSHISRPAFLHGVLPKLARSIVHSPRRRSISCIPVSPLARTPSVGSNSIRSPSPLATKNGGTVMSPTGSQGRSKLSSSPGSPLLRRALSPDRLVPPITLEDAIDQDSNLLMPSDRKLIRSQSMKESKRRRHKFLR